MDGAEGKQSPPRILTPGEYLAFERQSEERHEYVDGRVITMPYSTPRHSLILIGVGVSIYEQVRNRDCFVFMVNMRLKIEALNVYTYADAGAVCGELMLEDAEQDTLLNPTMLIEVMSPTTELSDRVTRFARYRHLPSFREYVLVAEDRPLIEQYVRQDDGTWSWSVAEDPGGSIFLPTMDCTITLADIYRQVTFSSENASDKPTAGIVSL